MVSLVSFRTVGVVFIAHVTALNEVGSQEGSNFIGMLNCLDGCRLSRPQLSVVKETGADLILRFGEDRGIAWAKLERVQGWVQYFNKYESYLGKRCAQRA